MAGVKWIKLTVDMFDNRKIKHLRRLPEGNSIVLIWVMLLTMAGRCNANGMIFLTENIPYTPKMLADELGFEENLVRLALDALERLNMIRTDNFLTIPGWEEYQNIEGMDKIRAQTRQRVARHREKQRQLASTVSGHSGELQGNGEDATSCNVTCNSDVTPCNATDIEEDIEGEVDIEGDKENNNNLFIHDSEKNFSDLPENVENPIDNSTLSPEMAAKRDEYIRLIRNNLLKGDETGEWLAAQHENIAVKLGIPGVSVAAIREELNAEKEDHVSA